VQPQAVVREFRLPPFFAIKGNAVQKVVWRQLSIAILIMATNVCVSAQDIEKGRIEFLSNCAGCHGADGKGAGRMSDKLEIKPADLTVLARRNNGVFSPDAIAERIDGRSAPHRSSEMPIWGADKDLRRARKEKPMNPSRLTHCWICLATLRRLSKNEYGISSSISLKSRRNRFAAVIESHVGSRHETDSVC